MFGPLGGQVPDHVIHCSDCNVSRSEVALLPRANGGSRMNEVAVLAHTACLRHSSLRDAAQFACHLDEGGQMPVIGVGARDVTQGPRLSCAKSRFVSLG